MRRISPVFLAALLGACAQPVTQLVVVVDSDYLPGTELARVTIQTFDPAMPSIPRDTATREVARMGDATHVAIPFSFAVVPGERPDSSEVELEITGALAGGTTVRRVRTRFLAGATAIVRVHLSRACEDVACPVAGTCEHGECTPLVREPVRVDGLIPGSELDAGGIDASAPDAAADGGSDAGPDGSVPVDGGIRIIECVTTGLRPVFANPGSTGADYEVGFDGAALALLDATAGLVLRTAEGTFSLTSDVTSAPHLAPTPGGWMTTFVSAGVIRMIRLEGTELSWYGDSFPSERGSTAAADGTRVFVAFAATPRDAPSYATFDTAWSVAQQLETGPASAPPVIRARNGALVYAWGESDIVRARRLLNGASVDVQPTHYAATASGPIVAVAADVAGSEIATVAWAQTPFSQVLFSRFEGESADAASVTIQPDGLPVVGAPAIALRDDGVAAVLVRSQRELDNELWLALIDRAGEVRLAHLRDSRPTPSTRQWIWPVDEQDWVVAFEEGTDVYAMNVTCP